MQSTSPTETIECPLCAGAGKLKRTEVLDRLGVKDFARVAQLSAEEAFRLLMQKHNHDQQNGWARFETELARRTAEIREQHKDALRSAQSERSGNRFRSGLYAAARLDTVSVRGQPDGSVRITKVGERSSLRS